MAAELGVPIPAWTPHNLARRFSRLQAHLIRSQSRGSLWTNDAVAVAVWLYSRQRQYGIYRRRPVVEKPARAKRSTPEELARLKANIEAIVKKWKDAR